MLHGLGSTPFDQDLSGEVVLEAELGLMPKTTSGSNYQVAEAGETPPKNHAHFQLRNMKNWVNFCISGKLEAISH